MEFKKFMNLGMKTEDGVLITKYLVAIHKADEANVLKIKGLFDAHNYDLSIIPGAFIKIFAANEKEIAEIKETLEKAEKLGLNEIFNANLKVATFKKAIIDRIEYCINNAIPFLNSDNSLISMLYSSEAFAQYSAKATIIEDIKTTEEINANPVHYEDDKIKSLLDDEDLIVKADIIKTLTEINKENSEDMTLKFIISTIISNIDGVIANDNKNYRIMGTEHIVEGALAGVALTPEMQEIIESKILKSFNRENEMKIGRTA